MGGMSEISCIWILNTCFEGRPL